MAAIVAAVIGAAASLYAQHRSQQAAKKVGGQQDRLYGIQADTAEKLQPYALDFYKRSSEAADPALSYYRALASGDKSQIYGALSPELSNIGSKYRSLIGASSELNQRGGVSASYAAELPFKAADEQTSLVNGARASAYGNLSSLAGQFANVGAGAAGGSQNAAQGAGSTLNNAYIMSMINGQGANKAYGDVGNALAEMWKKYRSPATGTGQPNSTVDPNF